MKLRAGALLYAIFISVIISIFCCSILLIYYYSGISTESFINHEKLKDEALSAIQLSLSGYEGKVNLYSSGIKTSIKKEKWGCFDLIRAYSEIKNDSVVKMALAGSTGTKSREIALFLSDPGQSLSVCGNVELCGKCYLPGGIIKKVNIEGRYEGSQTITYKKIYNNSDYSPVIDPSIFEILDTIEQMQMGVKRFQFYSDYQYRDTITRSFGKETFCLYSSDAIEIGNKYIAGHIIIVSDILINLGPGCELHDAILVAPQVNITGVRNSSIQVYASEKIHLKHSTSLDYPTALVTYNPSSALYKLQINICDSSSLSGTIILCTASHKNSSVFISERSSVEGIIYSTDYIENKGTVTGSLFARKLLYKSKHTSYENVLMDAKINSENLSEYYVTPAVFLNMTGKKIIKWLN